MNARYLGLPLLLLGLTLPAPATAAGKTSRSKSGPASPAAAATGTVNLNAATPEQISLLPRVGIKVARRIVDYRKTNGDFKRIEDVMEVKGVGEKLFVSLKPHLSISGPTTLTAKVKSTGTRKGRAKPAKA